jgi:hypothetical protein
MKTLYKLRALSLVKNGGEILKNLQKKYISIQLGETQKTINFGGN